MPLQNRVTPDGDMLATSTRGTLMGNRGGRFHRPDKTLSNRRWASKAWITCRLEFKGRHREVMGANSYTELFFLDEATALAAGHRPCFECRRADAVAFAKFWHLTHDIDHNDAGADYNKGAPECRAKADVMDEILHAQRLTASGDKKTHDRRIGDIPDGTIIRWCGHPHLLARETLWQWSHDGYRPASNHNGDQQFGKTRVEVLTPPAIVAVISRGYLPQIHPSAL